MADANKKMRACVEFFNELAALLSDRYEIVCPFDKTGYRSDKYLVPNGTADEITYYGKPLRDIRRILESKDQILGLEGIRSQ